MLEDDEFLKVIRTDASGNKDDNGFFIEFRLIKHDEEYGHESSMIFYDVDNFKKIALKSIEFKVNFFELMYKELKKFYVNPPDEQGWWTIPREAKNDER